MDLSRQIGCELNTLCRLPGLHLLQDRSQLNTLYLSSSNRCVSIMKYESIGITVVLLNGQTSATCNHMSTQQHP